MNDSRWYYGVVAVMALEAIGFGLVGIAQTAVGEAALTSLSGEQMALIGAGLIGALLVVVSFLLLPVFCLSLYLDARAVRDSGESWDPNPKFWAVGAFFLQVAALVSGVTLYLFIGLWYLFRRFRSSPIAVADEEAWAEQEAAWEEESNDV
jgi:hypothetical protein